MLGGISRAEVGPEGKECLFVIRTINLFIYTRIYQFSYNRCSLIQKAVS